MPICNPRILTLALPFMIRSTLVLIDRVRYVNVTAIMTAVGMSSMKNLRPVFLKNMVHAIRVNAARS